MQSNQHTAAWKEAEAIEADNMVKTFMESRENSKSLRTFKVVPTEMLVKMKGQQQEMHYAIKTKYFESDNLKVHDCLGCTQEAGTQFTEPQKVLFLASYAMLNTHGYHCDNEAHRKEVHDLIPEELRFLNCCVTGLRYDELMFVLKHLEPE